MHDIMKLLIVESPAKAKTIAKYLDNEYTVKASIGHVRDLPKSNKAAIDIEAGFVPKYEISKGKEDVIAELKSLSKKATEVVLATDPDREGEAIAWHLSEALGLKKAKRVVFYEITKDAVKEAIKHPREIDQNLRRAQEARRVLDRLVGYDLSGLIWKKVRYGLSAGRVQSPALRIVMEREREIRAFKPETFWTLEALTETPAHIKLLLSCAEEPREKARLEAILKDGNAKSWKVTDVSETEAKRAPRPPFTTSTLQQAASSRLGFAPSRTMGLAQKLYEAGHITYMRTDSVNLSKVAVAQIAAMVEKQFGKEYVEARVYTAKSKNAQEAHEAIRPTDASKRVAGKNDDEALLYELIWQRTVASQMADAKVLRTRIVGKTDAPDFPDFAANGSRTLFPGWLKADPEGKGEDVELPKVAVGDALKLIELSSLEKQTEPPARYSEAGLVKELEKRGIGRPSTYASIIRTIEERGYVEKQGKALVPTDTGDVVSTFLEAYFPDYIGDTFTAEMEDKLDDIAEGKRDYEKTLSDFYKPFAKDVKAKDKMEKATNLGLADAKYVCPKCAGTMEIKLGKNGKFLSCSRYPDCDGALMMDGTEIKKDEPIAVDPETGKSIYVLVGKYGPYVQLGEKAPKKVGRAKKGDPKPEKPRMASIPKGKDLTTVTLEDAKKYLSLPKKLGAHPTSGKMITASIGRFGPYVVHDTDFRSVKPPLDIYAVTLEQALELLAQEKKPRGFKRKAKPEIAK